MLFRFGGAKASARKYEIKAPRSCEVCDRAESCEFLKLLHEKSYDASGVLLACKAFYTVFCELEERCRVPHDDPDVMRRFHEEADTGKRPYLDPALVTNGVLAAELVLKALILRETGSFECTHYLDKLFYSLPAEHLDTLTSLIKEETHQNDETLRVNLEIIRDFFVEWRYFFESEAIGYGRFLLEFIHIVCDYAISELEADIIS